MKGRLRPIARSQVMLNQPLKWDAFSAKGRLLLHKGYVIASENQLEILLEHGMYIDVASVEKASVVKEPDYDPFLQWDSLRMLTSKNSLDVIGGKTGDILTALDQKVSAISGLLQKSTDIALFELMQMEMTNYVAAHNLQTAVMVAILAKKLNWDQTSINTLCRAGSTMNIAMLELQSTLAAQREPVTTLQRREIDSHGHRGRAILEELGVNNQDWLRAVEQHHPEYISGNSAASEMATIIHHVDVYLAKVSPRSFRGAKAPNVAAKEMLQQKGISQALASVIVKEIGIYPPGSYVRLANGETAIVTQRGEQVHTPVVSSLLNSSGMPLGEPVQRNTGNASFAIASIIPRNRVMVSVNRQKLFGKKKYTGIA